MSTCQTLILALYIFKGFVFIILFQEINNHILNSMEKSKLAILISIELILVVTKADISSFNCFKTNIQEP